MNRKIIKTMIISNYCTIIYCNYCTKQPDYSLITINRILLRQVMYVCMGQQQDTYFLTLPPPVLAHRHY